MAGSDHYQAESIALRAVQGRLPVRTPDIAFVGDLEGWPYLVMERLHGELLVDCFSTLGPREWHSIATQTGELAAALHQVSTKDASSLQRDCYTSNCGGSDVHRYVAAIALNGVSLGRHLHHEVPK